MTVKELYEWAKSKNWEEFEISIPIVDVDADYDEVSVTYRQSKVELRPELGNGCSIELHPVDEYNLRRTYRVSLCIEED